MLRSPFQPMWDLQWYYLATLTIWLFSPTKIFVHVQADFMQWSLKEVPNQPLLNTAGWRFLVPQLYKKYPNADMSLNITLPSPPVIRISEHPIFATVNVDLIVDVVEAGELIPVACISLVSLLLQNWKTMI